MRTFVALNIPLEYQLKQILQDLKHKLLGESIKWVDISTLHLTLFFLGDTQQRTIDEINDAFKQQIEGFPRFSLSLKGIGTFGTRVNPKVIWIGVSPSESLVELNRLVVENIKPLGFIPDERGFNPHITLGRIKHVKNNSLIYELVDGFKNKHFQETLIDRVVLYKSELTPHGPIYKPLIEQMLNS